MERILIVEDESSIRKFLKISLKRANFDVIEAETGEDALKKVREESPKIVILDIMLPGIDGFKVCEILKKEYEELGIIMLTARAQDGDKIMGLEYGADHYLVKPFNPLELIAIINSLIRRMNYGNKRKENSEFIYSGPFKIDLYGKKVYKNEEELDLTPKEYLLMKIFMENPNKAFSRDELLDMVWGYNYIGENKIIDVNMRRIRSKIEENPSDPKYIETVWGTGYRWKD